jgi:hypothetical protein
MEIWLMWKHRNIWSVFRAETISIFITLVLYLFAVFLFAPGYIEHVVPDALNNYDGFKKPIQIALLRITEAILVYLLAIYAVIRLFKNPFKDNWFSGFLIAGFAFLLSAIAQQKGWYYQIYPALFYFTLAIGFKLLKGYDNFSTHTVSNYANQIRIGLITILGILILQPVSKQLIDGYSKTGTTARVDKLEAVITDQANKRDTAKVSVFAFITSPRDVHPAILNSRATWAHSAGALVYLPAALSAQSAEPKPDNYMSIIETAKSHDQKMISSFLTAPPDILIVYNGADKLGISDPGFDYLEYYLADERFAELFEQYEEEIPVFWYRIFTRKN